MRFVAIELAVFFGAAAFGIVFAGEAAMIRARRGRPACATAREQARDGQSTEYFRDVFHSFELFLFSDEALYTLDSGPRSRARLGLVRAHGSAVSGSSAWLRNR